MADLEFPAPSTEKAALEGGDDFTPRFDSDGLITAIVTDVANGALLMVGHMNSEALALTMETGFAYFWSRSRGRLWKKGETSGNFLEVAELRTDCDQDALWLKAKVAEGHATCHTGRRSCFYRIVQLIGGQAKLLDDGGKALFDPREVYGDKN